MTLRPVRCAALLAAAALASACSEPQPEERPGPAAPVSLRGAVLMEPPRLGIGEVAVVEVAVVTPPGHRVRPVAPPETLPGLWLLDAETPPASLEAGRWVHRTRFRVRARETGSFEWPAQEVQVEGPDGAASSLALEARPFEVESVAKEMPGRVEPFGLRGPRGDEPAPGGFWGPALLGALSALAGVGLIHLVRRLRRPASADTPEVLRSYAEPDETWRTADTALAAADTRALEDPRGAADQISAALRLFMTQRFGLRADALTTEELARANPPFAMTTRWPALLDLLARLDDLRFRTAGPERGASPGLRDAVAEARRLLADFAPRENAG